MVLVTMLGVDQQYLKRFSKIIREEWQEYFSFFKKQGRVNNVPSLTKNNCKKKESKN